MAAGWSSGSGSCRYWGRALAALVACCGLAAGCSPRNSAADAAGLADAQPDVASDIGGDLADSGVDSATEVQDGQGAEAGDLLDTGGGDGTVLKPIDEHIVLAEVQRNSDALWSFLLFSGYLRAKKKMDDSRQADGPPLWQLEVPNREVSYVFRKLFADVLTRGLGGSNRVAALCKALLTGNADEFEQLLSELLLTPLSFQDIAVRPAEAIYQAFVAGLLVALDPSHEVTTNREAGLGCYDVLVAPRVAGGPGVVLELKVLRADRGETAEQGSRRRCGSWRCATMPRSCGCAGPARSTSGRLCLTASGLGSMRGRGWWGDLCDEAA